MTTESNVWVTVAGPARPDIAETQFAEWKSANQEWADQLSSEDILVDLIRALDGELRRYRVKRMPQAV